AIATLHELHPSAFPSEGARRFLTKLEHEAAQPVREFLPDASSKLFKLEDLGSGRLRIKHRSRDALCPILAGLLDGTGAHYQTPGRHVEEPCARRGDDVCTFVVEVQQTLLPTATVPRRR